MKDNEFFSDADRAREEEYFRRRERDLIDRLRREAGGEERTEERKPQAEAAQVVKTQKRWRWQAAAIAAIAGVAGLLWILTSA
jgi:hypothetical protein